MKNDFCFCFLLIIISATLSGFSYKNVNKEMPSEPTINNDPKYLIIRCDNIGLCKSVNEALVTMINSGTPISASVLFPAPASDEAIKILKQHPEILVGIHLDLNAEWKGYHWGPVAGATAVPSLVDSEGYFFSSAEAFFAHNPKIAEVEKEFRAQIERALHSGLTIDYIDTHMSTPTATPELWSLVNRLAAEYHLKLSGNNNEVWASSIYSVPPDQKTSSLVDIITSLQPNQTYLIVDHIGLETPEMNALVDANPDGAKDMSKNRHAELIALTSKNFQEALLKCNVHCLTYREYFNKLEGK